MLSNVRMAHDHLPACAVLVRDVELQDEVYKERQVHEILQKGSNLS